MHTKKVFILKIIGALIIIIIIGLLVASKPTSQIINKGVTTPAYDKNTPIPPPPSPDPGGKSVGGDTPIPPPPSQ